MPVTIKLRDVVAHFDRLDAEMHRAARIGLLKAAERGVQILVTQIIPSRSPQPVDRGVYRAGWKTERVNADTVAIMNPEPHAVFIEYGVRGENVKIGRAMIQALTEWVIRKGLGDGDKAVSIAWAIARNMQRDGIFNRREGPGLGILKELEEVHLARIAREAVAREMQRAVRGTR